MAHLVMLGFEEMNQPIKVYASGNRSVAERDIEIAKEIMARMWAAWPPNASMTGWPEAVSGERGELCSLFPVFARERIISGTMHPRTTFGGDWLNWYIVEVDEG